MFPIIGLGEPYIPRFGGVLQECGYFTWRVAESEELVGHTGTNMTNYFMYQWAGSVRWPPPP